MAKVLVELKNGAVMSVAATTDDVEVYVFDHDMVASGTIGELKRYLGYADAPVEVDAVIVEDELMSRVEDLIAEGQAKIEDMTGVWEDDEAEAAGDLTMIMRRR